MVSKISRGDPGGVSEELEGGGPNMSALHTIVQLGYSDNLRAYWRVPYKGVYPRTIWLSILDWSMWMIFRVPFGKLTYLWKIIIFQ